MTDNELIAQFMGFVLQKPHNAKYMAFYKRFHSDGSIIAEYHPDTEGNFKLLRFDKSWEWLMPVVEKINSTDRYTCISMDSGFVFLHRRDTPMLMYTIEPSIGLLKTLYAAVVEYIKTPTP